MMEDLMIFCLVMAPLVLGMGLAEWIANREEAWRRARRRRGTRQRVRVMRVWPDGRAEIGYRWR